MVDRSWELLKHLNLFLGRKRERERERERERQVVRNWRRHFLSNFLGTQPPPNWRDSWAMGTFFAFTVSALVEINAALAKTGKQNRQTANSSSQFFPDAYLPK